MKWNSTIYSLALILAVMPLLISCAEKKPEKIKAGAVLPSGPPQPAWTDAQYARFDEGTFANHPPAKTIINPRYIDYGLMNAAVFYATNRQRAQNGVEPLQHSPGLEAAAAGHSRDMVEKNFFSHDNPAPGRENLVARLRKAGIVNARAAENITIGFILNYEAGKAVYDPKQNGGYFSYKYKGEPISNHTYLGIARSVLKSWMKSPGHRKNILNPQLNYLGVGGAAYLEDVFWHKVKFTQNFSDQKGEG